jgi:NADH dehydrogenase
VKASPLGALLAQATGAELDRAGRVLVQADLTVPNHPEIFVIGDLASIKTADGKPVPGVAPAAMQQGKFVAWTIRQRLSGGTTGPFIYRDKGNLATIGRHAAVADLHWLTFWGFPAWLIWLLIHLFYIIVFENRILIMVQWAWSYWLRGRSARLITGEVPKQLVEPRSG